MKYCLKTINHRDTETQRKNKEKVENKGEKKNPFFAFVFVFSLQFFTERAESGNLRILSGILDAVPMPGDTVT